MRFKLRRANQFTMTTRISRSLTHLVLAAVLFYGAGCAAAAEEEGIALAIVYDSSGSMRESVRTGKGEMSPKYVIGNRALEAVVNRIQAFATNAPAGAPRKIHTGLYIFSGNGAREVVKFGPFDPEAIRTWLKNYPGPTSGTPLGTALETASKVVLESKLSHKHLLVITDGLNTVGPDPAAVVPRIQKQAEAKNCVVFTHFVAFDINANVFAPLKKMGVTVVGAADEKQLNSQLEFILEEKILLEKEEKK